MKAKIFYFSATGKTKQITNAVCDGIKSLNGDVKTVSINSSNFADNNCLDDDTTALFVFPVFNGRLPSFVPKCIDSIKGKGYASVIVTYGNRDFDDALLELRDIVSSNGFNVISAAAFSVQHSIYNELAKGRPDLADMQKAFNFGIDTAQKAESVDAKLIDGIKGNRPYKFVKTPTFLMPKGHSKCNACGVCVSICPVGAIEKKQPEKTDKSKCVACMACVTACPVHTRRISLLAGFMAKMKLKKYNGSRQEPYIVI